MRLFALHPYEHIWVRRTCLAEIVSFVVRIRVDLKKFRSVVQTELP